MLAARRMRWLMLLFAYYAIQWLAAFVPAVGPLVMMIGRPVFTVGFLSAAWTQQRGGVPRIGHLFHGFRTDLRALLPIGVVLVAGTIFAVLATALVDGGALLDMISAGGRPDEAIVASPRIEIAMLFGIVCALPTLRAVWFAPALANWRPLAVYGLLLFFYGAVLPGMAIAIIAVIAPSEGALYVIALLIGVPYYLMFSAVQAISDYVAYRDVFHPPEVAVPQSPETGAP